MKVTHYKRISTHPENTPFYIKNHTYPSEKITENINSVEELVKKYPPKKPSKGLMSAIKESFNNKTQVTYNYGVGNVTFYFS